MIARACIRQVVGRAILPAAGSLGGFVGAWRVSLPGECRLVAAALPAHE
jgi:hypothetical protein